MYVPIIQHVGDQNGNIYSINNNICIVVCSSILLFTWCSFDAWLSGKSEMAMCFCISFHSMPCNQMLQRHLFVSFTHDLEVLTPKSWKSHFPHNSDNSFIYPSLSLSACCLFCVAPNYQALFWDKVFSTEASRSVKDSQLVYKMFDDQYHLVWRDARRTTINLIINCIICRGVPGLCQNKTAIQFHSARMC